MGFKGKGTNEQGTPEHEATLFRVRVTEPNFDYLKNNNIINSFQSPALNTHQEPGIPWFKFLLRCGSPE
jgi:hypothetical protein